MQSRRLFVAVGEDAPIDTTAEQAFPSLLRDPEVCEDVIRRQRRERLIRHTSES